MGVFDVIESTACGLGDAQQALDIGGLMGKNSNTCNRNFRLPALIEQLRGRRLRVAIADDYNVLLSGVSILEFVVGGPQLGVKAGHVTHHHIIDSSENGFFVTDLGKRNHPIVAALPVVSEDTDQIEPT